MIQASATMIQARLFHPLYSNPNSATVLFIYAHPCWWKFRLVSCLTNPGSKPKIQYDYAILDCIFDNHACIRNVIICFKLG